MDGVNVLELFIFLFAEVERLCLCAPSAWDVNDIYRGGACNYEKEGAHNYIRLRVR